MPAVFVFVSIVWIFVELAFLLFDFRFMRGTKGKLLELPEPVFAVVLVVTLFGPLVSSFAWCAVESGREKFSSAVEIAANPRAWLGAQVRGCDGVTGTGVNLVIDLKLADLRDAVSKSRDPKSLLVYGAAIEALEKEKARIAEIGGNG